MTIPVGGTDLRQLMKLLHGELEAHEVKEFRQRLAAEPDLQKAYRQLEETWCDLELPATSSTPPRLRASVLERLREEIEERPEASWALLPRTVRAAAAFALLAGGFLGFSVSDMTQPEDALGLIALEREASLTDQYWQALEDSDSWQMEGEVAP